MTKLAILGGKPAVTKPLLPYDSINQESVRAKMAQALYGPLSGYLGGERKGGYWVEKLEAAWCEAFNVKHAVACNSATSGLLMACIAADVRIGDHVVTTPYTMSATAAAPKFLRAHVTFADIETNTYCINPKKVSEQVWRATRAIIATNLFGHPARLQDLKKERCILIEDNAQAPFATEYGQPTGTIGHIGVFSLNVHKHFQAGEGGVCVTNNDAFADIMRDFRNHGEMGPGPTAHVGLNLRMTELVAAVACGQLEDGQKLVSERVEIAENILSLTRGLPSLWAPITRPNCRHVYYCLPFWANHSRNEIVDALIAEGVPMQKGYVRPLYHLPAFREGFTSCPKAESAYKHVALYENCQYSPTSAQVKQIGEAFNKVMEFYAGGK